MEFNPMNSARGERRSGQMMPAEPIGQQSYTKRGLRMPGVPVKLILVIILLIQFLGFGWLILFSPYSQYLQSQTVLQQIINEVSRLTPVNLNEQPQISVVTNPDTLRSENDIQARVYKDAQRGDYVLVYSNEMIIYHRDPMRIVYVGDSPTTIANKNQQAVVTAITQKAKDARLIPSDSTETPQLSVVTDAEQVKTQDATFYADAQKDDVVAVFPSVHVIILFRPSTGNMVASGTLSTSITLK